MKSVIRQGIKSAFQAMSSIKKDATLKHFRGEEYNESTGKSTSTYSEHSVKVVVVPFSRSELREMIISSDSLKVFLPASQIPVTPKAGKDYLVFSGYEPLLTSSGETFVTADGEVFMVSDSEGTAYLIEEVRSKFNELFILKI